MRQALIPVSPPLAGTRTGGAITVHVPIRFSRRYGRKHIEFLEDVSDSNLANEALIKALARAFRWKQRLDGGEFQTLGDLAKSEDIAPSYLTRVLRLTLLAPGIVCTILDGKQASGVTLAKVLDPFPEGWAEQANHFRGG